MNIINRWAVALESCKNPFSYSKFELRLFQLTYVLFFTFYVVAQSFDKAQERFIGFCLIKQATTILKGFLLIETTLLSIGASCILKTNIFTRINCDGKNKTN